MLSKKLMHRNNSYSKILEKLRKLYLDLVSKNPCMSYNPQTPKLQAMILKICNQAIIHNNSEKLKFLQKNLQLNSVHIQI